MSGSIINRGGVVHSVGLACLSTLLAASLAAPAFAADNTGSTKETLTMNASAQLSVTAPTRIDYVLESDGSFTCPDASAVTVENHSAVPVAAKSWAADVKAGNAVEKADFGGATAKNAWWNTAQPDSGEEYAFNLSQDELYDDWNMAADGQTLPSGQDDTVAVTTAGAMKNIDGSVDFNEAKQLSQVTWMFGTELNGKDLSSKSAAEWTVADQKAIAQDISANGTSSKYYPIAKAAMDNDVQWTVELTDGTTLTYHIIGIGHDKLSGSDAKAGLTFQATHSLAKAYQMNATNTNVGGWEQSALRASMNSGEIWGLLPSDLQDSIASVDKLTNNERGDTNSASVTATSDKLFLLSYAEYVPTSYWATSYPWTAQEGSQYEFWAGKVTNNKGSNACLENLYKTAEGKTPTDAYDTRVWERSAHPYGSTGFLLVYSNGNPTYSYIASNRYSVSPAWCF